MMRWNRVRSKSSLSMSSMRWVSKALFLTLLLLWGTGCTRTLFLSKEDLDNVVTGNIPADLESDTTMTVRPGITGTVATPPTVDHAERPPRHLTLQEAIALALENGTVSDGGGSTGIVNDQFAVSTGTGGGNLAAQSDKIRVLSYNPAIQAAFMEQSLSRFDAIWSSGMNYSTVDELQQGLQSFSNGSNASFQSTIVKGLGYGGVSNITFQTDYRNLANAPAGQFGVLNPQYTTRLIFGYEQPLWRDFGTEINQILNRFPSITGATMPGAAAAAFGNRQIAVSQVPSFTGVGSEGILVTRIRFDQQRAEFERRVNNLLLSVEVAYWRLYQAYGELYTFEEVQRIAHQVWMNYYQKVQAGQKAISDFAPIRGQYEEFKGDRIRSLGQILEAERNLRGIIGLPVEDGTRLVPITPPTMAPYQANWEAALGDAITLRPELLLARENLRIAQLNVVAMKNFLKPDLRLAAQYQPIGFGTTLDGDGQFIDGTGTPRTTNALKSLVGDHFNNWNIGLNMSVPLGFRLEHAQLRAGKLTLAQSYEYLKDAEERAKRSLYANFIKLSEWYARIDATRMERKAYGEGVKARYQELVIGKATVADGLLEVQRRFAQAMQKEFAAIAEYNISLARFEHSKGTLMLFDNVTINEGALPECVQVRAVEHERERSKAIVLRERPSPIGQPGQLVGDVEGTPQMVDLNQDPNVIFSQPTGMPGNNTPTTLPPLEKTSKKLPSSGAPNFNTPTNAAPAQAFQPSSPYSVIGVNSTMPASQPINTMPMGNMPVGNPPVSKNMPYQPSPVNTAPLFPASNSPNLVAPNLGMPVVTSPTPTPRFSSSPNAAPVGMPISNAPVMPQMPPGSNGSVGNGVVVFDE